MKNAYLVHNWAHFFFVYLLNQNFDVNNFEDGLDEFILYTNVSEWIFVAEGLQISSQKWSLVFKVLFMPFIVTKFFL